MIHPDAEKLLNCSNLQRVCERFSEVSNLEQPPIEMEMFSHVKPMLLERLKIEHIGRLFVDDGQRYYVQTKFDGERSQLHMDNGRFKYFTRRGYDITEKPMYGEFANTGKCYLYEKLNVLLLLLFT